MADLVNRRGKSVGVRLVRYTGKSPYFIHPKHPDHKIEYTPSEFAEELRAGGFEVSGRLMPVVYDTPWAGAIDALGGLSLGLYRRLASWKRQMALRRPDESTGFEAVAVKAARR